MRTFDEISEDIRRASGTRNAEALRALATEMQALGTPNAEASAYNALGIAAIVTGDSATALTHLGRALTLFAAVGDILGVAYVEGATGIVYGGTGNYPVALEHFGRALALCEELDNLAYTATTTSNIGNVYYDTGDYPSALHHFRRALALQEELGNRDGVALITGYIGSVYARNGDYAAALEHYHHALARFEEVGHRSGVADITNSIGVVNSDSGDHASALEHYRRALTLQEELGARASVTGVTGNVIGALMKLDRFDEAATLLERQASMLMDIPAVRAEHKANAATLAEHREDLDAAQRHLLEALAICTSVGARRESAIYHEMLRDLAQKRNDFAGYIEHNKEYQRITEEIRGKEATQRMAMMEAERKMEGERQERDKERALLYGALPKSVADRMIRGEKVTGDHFEHAAVLFIDVASFTTHTATMQPGDVVLLLEDLFSCMDNICDQHGAVKIKTIGDSYMCFRGDGTEAENALSIARVALDVARTPFTWPDGSPLVVRMGAHIGAATAGVIGTQRLQYDVWGDTVNVASRMESHGEPGRIHVSDAFAAALLSEGGGQRAEGNNNDSMTNDSMTLLERGSIEIKGKGPMTTYWLDRAS